MTTPRQRLVVCLDGTWNNRNDSTNVSHHYDLAINDDLAPGTPDEVRQLLYYDEGVGNGLLDGVTGGGFGIGLEENVREAYNWLIEHFNDSGSGATYLADEIFIFGFSRGAYTARSLAGFIGRCGLLRRGSPISVNQLWRAYCLLGRQHEQRSSAWDNLATDAPPFRQLSAIVDDPWKRQPLPPRPRDDREALLAAWSRRVRITYLGVYDTVGAMGLDALAIPGLRSRVALHHNMRPTTLIQNCRHALAIHEHRSSFAHTPFVAYYGSTSEEEFARAVNADDDWRSAEGNKWLRARRMWDRKIDQRWFVGAHSNVGGGYDDNTLARAPFRWLLAGAVDAGLRLKPDPAIETAACPRPEPVDSYAQFAAPFGTHLLRLKRRYRAISPPENLHAGDAPRAAFALETIDEAIDPSVRDYFACKPGQPLPPNLYAHVQRTKTDPTRPDAAAIAALADRELESHHWPPSAGGGALWTACWGAFAATGVASATQFFAPVPLVVPLTVGLVAAFGFVAVDWCESRLNHALAANTLAPARRPIAQATRDAVYWTRALGVVFAVVGIFSIAWQLWLAMRAPDGRCDWLRPDTCPFARWAMYALTAALAVIVGSLMDRRRDIAAWFALSAAPIGVGIALLMPPSGRALLAMAGIAPHVVADAAVAGPLLLLWLGLAYFVRSFTWVDEPIDDARLPRWWKLSAMLRLQFAARPMALLDHWRTLLQLSWRADDASHDYAGERLRRAVRESLWRDIVGFVPVYCLVLGFGAWLHSRWATPTWAPLVWLCAGGWPWVLATAAIADWIEDSLHLHYLRRQAASTSPGGAAILLGRFATIVKFAALAILAAQSLAALWLGTWLLLHAAPQVDWRGSLALGIAVVAVVALVGLIAAAVRAWLRPAPQPASTG